MTSAQSPVSGQAPLAARDADLSDRREGDRALRFWREREMQGGRGGINLDIVLPDTWAHCFVLLPNPDIEHAVLLAYGKNFARRFGLPIEAVPPVPIAGKFPPQITELLLQGCAEARQQNAAVRSEGKLAREDGRQELYRAVFIPVHEANREPRVFGSFNSKLGDAAPLDNAIRQPSQPAPPGFWQRLKNGLFSKPQ